MHGRLEPSAELSVADRGAAEDVGAAEGEVV